MFDLDGKQIQLYDEENNAIAMSNYANVNISTSNKSANISAMNANRSK